MTRPLTEHEELALDRTLPVGSTQVREVRVGDQVVRTEEVPIVGRAARRAAARAVRRTEKKRKR